MSDNYDKVTIAIEIIPRALHLLATAEQPAVAISDNAMLVIQKTCDMLTEEMDSLMMEIDRDGYEVTDDDVQLAQEWAELSIFIASVQITKMDQEQKDKMIEETSKIITMDTLIDSIEA